MELIKIEALLNKYEAGETTLTEEKTLKEYFLKENVPPHLSHYKSLFLFSKKEKAKTTQVEFKAGSKKKKFAFLGIAASILLALGVIGFYNNQKQELEQQNLGTIEDPEEAYIKAKETLQLVSEALNSSSDELTYVAEFGKVTNKYIKD